MAVSFFINDVLGVDSVAGYERKQTDQQPQHPDIFCQPVNAKQTNIKHTSSAGRKLPQLRMRRCGKVQCPCDEIYRREHVILRQLDIYIFERAAG